MTTTHPSAERVFHAPRLDAAMPIPGPSARSGIAGTALGLVALLLIGVVLQALVISPLRYERDQHVAYQSFRTELANGTAPVGQITADDKLVAAGTPVAILQIPALGIDDVVTEGSTSKDLISGPGHRRDTALPGQVGSSVIMGRQAAYGGPFGKLSALKPGDVITAITGQGEAKYAVTALRRAGSPLPPVLAAGAGRLTLVSAAGTPFLPDDVLRVDADLVTPAVETPIPVVSLPELGASELAYQGDASAWPWLVIWMLFLGAAILGFMVLRSWWGRGQSWIVCGPLVLLAGVLVSEQVLTLLPNLT